MAIIIKEIDIEHLATELASCTGETIVDAIRVALSERLERLRQCK